MALTGRLSRLFFSRGRQNFQIYFKSEASISSSSGSVTNLAVDEEKGFAILTLRNKVGNTLSTPIIDEMSNAITEVEKSKCRGMIITSAVKNIFCSGLNLDEFGGPSSTVESVTKYYGTFQDLWFQLYKSPLITIAAMNGHSIAGGCGIAMACDYRILATPQFGIGMNEMLFGVAVPYFLLDAMVLIMGYQNASKAALLGKIFTPDEAVKVGLVDELTATEDTLTSAEKQMKLYLKAEKNAQIATKMDIRQTMIDNFSEIKKRDLARVVATLQTPAIRKVLHAYIESVKNPKSK